MRFFKIISTAAVLAIGLVPSVKASPIHDSAATDVVAAEVENSPVLKKSSTAGWNDWNCVPTGNHPNPIVLVHGLLADGIDNWIVFAPRFVLKGYCVYSFTYGQKFGQSLIAGLDKMENSAQQLSDFIDKVLASTGASKVNILGHSEGSLLPRYYFKYLGGASKVDKFASIGPIVYGTQLFGLIPIMNMLGLYDAVNSIVSPLCESCFELLVNSAFLQDLNAGGDTVPGIKYLFIATKFDEMVTPPSNGFLRDNNTNVKNQWLQDWCPLTVVGHITFMTSFVAFNGINAFFDPQAPQTIDCIDAFE
ncbi:hypothetical protein BGZ72_010369 [Mortierella alpina]|nr:hypothetical protein BGZ72_010369 [Mortierella alpina]